MPVGVRDDLGGLPHKGRGGFLQHSQALMAPSVGQSPTGCQVKLGHTRPQAVKNVIQAARGHFPVNKQCNTTQQATKPITVSRTVFKTG